MPKGVVGDPGELAQPFGLLAADTRCLLEAAEHREQGRAREHRVGIGRGRECFGEDLERFVRGTRAEDEGAVELEEAFPALAGQPPVADRFAGSVFVHFVVSEEVGDAEPERIPDVHEAGVILGPLEQRQRGLCARLELVERQRVEERTMARGDDVGERRRGIVAGLAGPLAGGVGDRRSSPRFHERDRLGEIDLQMDVESKRSRQLQRALEQRRGPSLVAPPERAAAARRASRG
jgi:hypothetical protein